MIFEDSSCALLKSYVIGMFGEVTEYQVEDYCEERNKEAKVDLDIQVNFRPQITVKIVVAYPR